MKKQLIEIALIAIIFFIVWYNFPRKEIVTNYEQDIDTVVVSIPDTIEKIVPFQVTDTLTVVVEKIITEIDTVWVKLDGVKVTERTIGFDNNTQYVQILHKYKITSSVFVYTDTTNSDLYVKNDLSIKQLELSLKPIISNKYKNIVLLGAGLAYNGSTKFDVRIGYTRLFEKFTVGVDVGVNSAVLRCGFRF